MNAVADFAALYTAITGKTPDAATLEKIADACSLAGRGEDGFPAHVRTIAQDLAARRPRTPTEVPQADRGFSWLLGALEPALPGTEYRNELRTDLFVVEPLGLVVTMTRGVVPETYSIGSLPLPASAVPRDGLEILGTFNPTPEQVRAWAYSPNMRLTTQDEDLAVSHPVYLPLLLELAADVRCPKRVYLLAILDGYIVSARRGRYDRALLHWARDIAASAPPADLQEWAHDLGFLIGYIDGTGAVTQDTARTIARITMVGRYRALLVLTEATVRDWWEFSASTPEGHSIDRLYVSQRTGALVWSTEPLTAAMLAPLATAAGRDDSLAQRVRP